MSRTSRRRALGFSGILAGVVTALLIGGPVARANSGEPLGTGAFQDEECAESSHEIVEIVAAFLRTPASGSVDEVTAETPAGCFEVRPGQVTGAYIDINPRMAPGRAATSRMSMSLVGLTAAGQRDTLASLTAKNGKGTAMTGFPGFAVGEGGALEIGLNAKEANDLTDSTFFVMSLLESAARLPAIPFELVASRAPGDLVAQLGPEIEFGDGVPGGAVLLASVQFNRTDTLELTDVDVSMPFGTYFAAAREQRLKVPRKIQLILEQYRGGKRVARHKLNVKRDGSGQLLQKTKKLKDTEIRQGDTVEFSANPKGGSFAPGDKLAFLYNIQER